MIHSFEVQRLLKKMLDGAIEMKMRDGDVAGLNMASFAQLDAVGNGVAYFTVFVSLYRSVLLSSLFLHIIAFLSLIVNINPSSSSLSLMAKFESVPFAVASNLIHRLASPDFLEFGREYGVMEGLEELKNTVESINDKLLDADDNQDQNGGVRVWIRKFKKVLHHADDFLDDLAIEFRRDKLGAAEGKEVNKVLLSISSSNQIPLDNEMPDKIKEIRESFNDVVKEMKDLNLSPRSGVVKQTNREWRETCSFVLESDIIGRDDSTKEIISLLRQPHEKQRVSVIAIVGIGGLGKTTLAQLVYNDMEVRNSFEMQMWVCVSDNFDVKTILKEILESILGVQVEDKSSLDKLQRELQQKISGKKYLLVLDDIWNERHDKWAELRKYLMCGAQDSKILVTTRSKKVAKAMTASTSYLLKGLTDEESWSLLKNIAFEGDSKGVNQNLESMGKEIAKNCKGVPLAVKTLGGLLREQTEEREWENVLRGGFWKSCEEQDSIMPILKLSYHNLSPEMRQCFAYCSLYPKDSRIPKDKLIQLWTAQGYLEFSAEKHSMDVEDIGNQFVSTFFLNSFFQDAESDKHGRIIRFRMHDLMHDLAMLVAGNDCCYLDSMAEKVEGSPMHVSLESRAIHLLNSLDKSRLRTLILPDHRNFDEEEVPVANFKYLHVLKISTDYFHKSSDSIEGLKHLRYLGCAGYFPLNGMRGLGKLHSLQFLPVFDVSSQETGYGTLNELKDLNQLRGELRIENLDWVGNVALESQDVNLKEKKFLKSLTLDWYNEYYDEWPNHTRDCDSDSDNLQLLKNLQPHSNLKQLKVSYYRGVHFPYWLSLLTNVVHISLFSIGCRCLPSMERLPSLKSLEIRFLAELEYIYLSEDFAVTFFPSLESLVLSYCSKLRGWRRRRVGYDINDSHNLSLTLSFTNLSQLDVYSCSQLTCMPTFPKVKVLKWGQYSAAEPLIATLNTTCSADSSSSAAPLSMLKELTISDPTKLPKGWMQNLISLESLQVERHGSETLEEFETGFKDGTDCLPSLRKMNVSSCVRLKALPDWICNLSSLQHIEVSFCQKLESLPEGMSGLTNLKIFEVINCSLLLEECRTQTSAVSRQIAHIPQIILREK
ncbi:putative disease resistance protein RGA1 [Abrus precatorius]|uniref:Disease resistance protein RGA1 n=1 Tax=Abrus precatorius TaxID=3816 RepID=A0A8B8K0Q0_ABRPR|nr:putative disease resistance protein RGA1 [Abrus precatorius]